MKGLDQAVNIKSWPGNGAPAKPWGKLKQDPELWDECGDTLIFFARGRPEPSFRIQSYLMRETDSDVLIDMLLVGTVRSGTPGTPPGVSHKIYMSPSASTSSKLDVLRHHVTTRNFFAFLMRKPLVGFTFYQALVDLHDRLEEYLDPTTDAVEALKAYLVSLGLVNVSNEPRAAAGLLAWSEDVRWNEGWREAFVHSVGMWEQLNPLQESADISLATKAHLDRAHLDLQARIHEAEAILTSFYFDDAHYSQEDSSPSIRAISDRFRKFLKNFYEKRYQSWPIRKKATHLLWLDRENIDQIKHDFDCLYEYCVDRNVMLTGHELHNDRQSNKTILKSKTTENFWVDAEDDRMLGVFRNFDCRNNNANIPHPYPILPESIPMPAGVKKSMFKHKKADKVRDSRIAHAYAVANNASQMGREFAENDLLEAFMQFEKSDNPSEVDPREGRRERWIIIYCVLQTLANIAVDVPYLSFKTNVNYFLNTRLEGLPPWSPEEKIFEEASLEQSHCWTHPPCWADTRYERPDRRTSTTNRANSFARSHRDDSGTSSSAGSRPLSPESHFSNDFHRQLSGMDGTSGIGIATSYSPIGSMSALDIGTPPPLTETSSLTDPSLPPDVGGAGSSRPSLLPPKFAALSGISEYSTKPLPTRFSKSPSGRLKPGIHYDSRFPKRSDID